MQGSLFIVASAGIVFALGTVHLLYTFLTPKFDPRDADLAARMREVSPVLTRQTTMWKAWVGFNASHSLGAQLFGAVYGYLAFVHKSFLAQSTFLLTLGLVLLLAYLVLAWRYWFAIPLRGLMLATACYVAGWALGIV